MSPKVAGRPSPARERPSIHGGKFKGQPRLPAEMPAETRILQYELFDRGNRGWAANADQAFANSSVKRSLNLSWQPTNPSLFSDGLFSFLEA